MEWLKVMTLPDGTTVEMPIPPLEGTGHGDEAAYRVRGSRGVTEFTTMPEVLHHLAASGAGAVEDPPTATAADGCNVGRSRRSTTTNWDEEPEKQV